MCYNSFMKPNEAERKFELCPLEVEALGLERVQDSWPMDNPVGLLELAQRQHISISTRDLSEFPKGAQKSHQEQQQWELSGHLGTLIGQISPYLPSAAEGAEAFLRQEQE